MSDRPGTGDLLGIWSFGEAIVPLSKGVVAGASAFLSRICLPAAEEFGLLLRDRVSAWRAKNTVAIIQGAEAKLNEHASDAPCTAPPRLVAQILEQGSWNDQADIQQMWAGLLATACTPDGNDDSNLLFVDLLSKLTASEARVFAYACKHAEKRVSEAGWLHAYHLSVPLSQLKVITGIQDHHRLARELAHLFHLGILRSGFALTSTDAEVTPTGLGLQMYARCEGCNADPAEFLRAAPSVSITPESPIGATSDGDHISSGVRVLVADDEPTLVRMLGSLLERAGYSVRTATSGQDALDLITSEEIDVMLLDLHMPEMSGDQVFDAAVARQPHLRQHTLFMSGDSSDAARQRAAACGCRLLLKPFRGEELISLLSLLASSANT